jgi:hypothetical protein
MKQESLSKQVGPPLIAWVHDDYGDGQRSLQFFGNRISEEQKKIAEKTRKAVKVEIGAYAEFKAAMTNPQNVSPVIQIGANALAAVHITAQWVTANDAKAAEDCYFKINQAATPIDPTERRILQSRQSPNVIAARAITRAGTGHKYWLNFDKPRQEKIEQLGHDIYNSMYEPPMQEGAVKTLDLPVAGRGYNALPFVFDLVNQTNGIKIADSTRSKQVANDVLEKDVDGIRTLEFLGSVKRRLDRIVGKTASSLGPHPLVYFYTRSGAFQPSALLAFDLFIDALESDGKTRSFIKVREEFENFLIRNKEHLGHIVHKYGSGNRSVQPIAEYFKSIKAIIEAGNKETLIEDILKNENNYAFLFSPRPANYKSSDEVGGKAFGRHTKSATFINEALLGATRCQICHGLVHCNSIQIDHVHKKEHGGSSDMKNAQIAHPYCNSAKG